MAAAPETPTVSWVILTRGDRPLEFSAAIQSVVHLNGPAPEVVLVSNGAGALLLPMDTDRATVVTVELDENVGIPAGRNAGINAASGELIFFLDDDAAVASPDLVERVLDLFAEDSSLGIVTFRLQDPDTGVTERRWVPRLRVGDPTQSGPVTTFLGGACAVRRAVLDDTGLYAGQFFYSMEESDLSWRALDAGWSIHYLGDAVVHHKATSPSRHPGSTKQTARNRVWLARRNLPAPLAAGYLTVWTALTMARTRSMGTVRGLFAGLREGMRSDAGNRKPMSWRTAWRMTRLGRPPII